MMEVRDETILDNQGSVELRQVNRGGNLYYIDGENNIYDKKSSLQKFENCVFQNIKTNMADTIKQTTEAFLGSIMNIAFSQFDGKKVGSEFTVDDCVAKLMEHFGNEIARVWSSSILKKRRKRKEPRRIWFNISFPNKEMLNEKIAKILEETGEKKTPPSVAGPLWKALSDEEKKVYNDKAAALA